MAKSNAARKLHTDVRPKAPLEQRTGEIATNLDRLLHDRMRLGIVSALAAGDELSFTDLKAALSATDGNLSVHARKLEEAGRRLQKIAPDARRAPTKSPRPTCVRDRSHGLRLSYVN